MLSYRHAFHAGNHADVLKHMVQVFLLRHLAQKDKPWWFVDTHAGAAEYALDGEWARKNAEHETGIARLWSREDLPAAVADYVNEVRRLNPGGALLRYPGSPQLALQLSRPDDRLRLFELHSTESRVLQDHFAGAGSRVLVKAGDGYAGLPSVLPPPPRRALVLIDPSYEDKGDYARVRTALEDAQTRFATGTYLVWYPQVQRREAHELAGALKRVARGDWLHAALTVKAPAEGGHGLHGSGLFILNPPWTLPAMLRECLPYLVRVLGQDARATQLLEHRIA
ncbi:MAG: 23S rRNA (adenine(2030)-N(6))-methyltransferase RlmJ [Betaproteobacteria bacterium]|nr:23S rRNA (adenine(2030)-N(6))-methyltransferase RlmJ [Betaproteobacteria bacterium]